MIKTLEVVVLFKNKYFQVENNSVKFNEQKVGEHLRVIPTSQEGVAVLPIMDNGMVMIQDEYRYAYNGYITQVVKGGLKEGQSPKMAALEELEEELSLSFTDLVSIGEFVEHPSIVCQKGYAFIAIGCKFKENSLNAEDTECFNNRRLIKFEDLLSDVIEGRITCAVTQMMVLKAQYYLNLKK